jgi:hypothetical protein
MKSLSKRIRNERKKKLVENQLDKNERKKKRERKNEVGERD